MKPGSPSQCAAPAAANLAAYDSSRTMSLERGTFHVVDLQIGDVLAIRIGQGEVWVTMEGDPEDYVSGVGEKLTFARPGRLVIEALKRCDIRIVLSSDKSQKRRVSQAIAA